MGRSARSGLIGAFVGASLFGQLACSGNGTMSFDESDSGSTAVVSPGEKLGVTLSYIGGSSYTGPYISSAAVQFDGDSVVPPYNPGGPTVRFDFEAVSPGTATISIPKTVPVDSPTAPPPPFTLNVTVN